MKKGVKILLSLMLICGLAACSPKTQSENPSAGFKAGTYEGTAAGYGGDIAVKVTLSADKIESIEVTADSETPSVGGGAIEKLTENMIEVQSSQVDIISGATRSSNGLIEAVNTALKAAGIDPSSLTPQTGSEEASTEEKKTSVVVVGAGGAGMTAAITIAQAGQDVILVEKGSTVGGNTSRATGGMNAAETHYQKEQSIDDSVETFIQDTLEGGHNLNNPDLVQTLAENSAAGIDWLDSIGAELTSIKFAGGATNMRSHRPLDGEGKVIPVGSYLVDKFKEQIDKLGIEVVYDAEVYEVILNENGAASGVKAKDGNKEYVIEADAVIVTTGGFGGNLDRVTEYRPDLAGYVSTCSPTVEGDAVDFLGAINADFVDMDQIQIHPTVIQADGYLISESLRGDGAILVNSSGKRFINELLTRDVVSAGVIAEEGSYAWLIVDHAMFEDSKVVQGYVEKGYMIEGADAAELAEKMGVDAAALGETLSQWSGYVKDGKDLEFGREGLDQTKYDLSAAPLYAAKIAPGIHHCMGGVRINAKAEVLNAEGTVIPGLFAAGEVTGGVHGGNRLGGNAVTDIVVFGRIAGSSAVASLTK